MRKRDEGDDWTAHGPGCGADFRGRGGFDGGVWPGFDTGLGPWADPAEGARIHRDQCCPGQGVGRGRQFPGHELAAAGHQDRGREGQRDRRDAEADADGRRDRRRGALQVRCRRHDLFLPDHQCGREGAAGDQLLLDVDGDAERRRQGLDAGMGRRVLPRLSQQRSAAGAERRGRGQGGQGAVPGRPRSAEEEGRGRKLTVRALVLAALAASLCLDGIVHASAEEAFVTNQLSDDLMVVDLATARSVATIPIGGKPAGVAVSADGRFAYVTSPDAKAVTVVDAATRQVAGRIEVGGGPLGIAGAPDGRPDFVADWYAAAVRVIDAASRSVTASIAVGASPSGLAVMPDGKLLLSADRDDDSVSVVDTATRLRRATIKVGTRPFGVTIDADGRRAYTANVGSNDVSVIDIAKAREIGRVRVGMRPYAVGLAQDRGFVTDQYGGTVSVFDLATLKPIKRINVGDYPEGIAATADGKRIIVACWESNTLDIIDAVELKVIGEVNTGDGPRAFGAFLRRTE